MAELLGALVKANLAAAAAVLLIRVLAPLARRYLGARSAYLLWAAAPRAMLESLLSAPTMQLIPATRNGSPASMCNFPLAWKWVLSPSATETPKTPDHG